MTNQIRILTLFILSTIILSINAQEPVLVSDFNLGTEGSFNKFNFKGVEFNNRLIFPIVSTALGEEIGVLEGNELSLLMDIFEGPESSRPEDFVLFDDRVYFSVLGANGGAIWSTDGTPENTQVEVDLEISSDRPPNGLTVSASGWLYYTFENTLYRYDGSTNELLSENVRFITEFEQRSDNFSTYRDEIAYVLEENDFVNLYTIENGSPVLLASSQETSGFVDNFGLKEINGGLIFSIDDQFDDPISGIYFYDTQNNTLTQSLIANSPPRRLDTFTNNTSFAFVSNEGFYTSNGVQGEEELLIRSEDARLFAGEELVHGIYEDRIVFFFNEGNFGDNFICLSDGTQTGTNVLLNPEDQFPSNVIVSDRFAFLATGTSNGFKPELYQVDMLNSTISNIFTYDLASNDTGSILFLGVLNERLYFISNLDPTVGQELFSLDVDISTATRIIEDLSADIQISRTHYQVVMDESVQLSAFIYSLDGKLIKTEKIWSNNTYDLPSLINGSYLINVQSNGKIKTQKFVKF